MIEELKIAVVNEVAMFVILFSLMIAALGLFIQETFKSNMIFRRYYVLLNYLHIKTRRSLCQKKVEKKVVKRVAKRILHKMLPPAGLCVYCNSSWLAILFYAYILMESNRAFVTNDIFILVLCIGMTYVWIKTLENIIN